MRTFAIIAGLLLAGAFMTGTPAKAELGCLCVKLGKPAVCSSGVSACTFQGGGACVLPCDYKPAKTAMKKKAKAKKKM